MSVLDALAMAFIQTFGITQPTEQTRRRAAWFILGMIVFVIAAVTVLGLLFVHVLRP